MKIRKLTNKGAALVTVIMLMLVTMALVGIVLSFITSQTKMEIFYENNIVALHSAEAGVNQYLWDLNKDSATSSVLLEDEVEYPNVNPVAKYFLHSTQDTADKKIIEATGWMLNDPSIKRTIKATFTKRSFTQYVYFSDNDPTDIWWMSSDNCYGPYHTNTSLYVSGSPTFWSNVTYVNQISYYTSPSVDHPNFRVTPQQVASINYPSDNNQLMSFAIADDYYYRGITRIRLNSDGTITTLNLNRVPNLETRNIPANGVIFVDGTVVSAYNKFNTNAGNIFISGVLEGKLTVAASNDIYVTGYDPILNNYNASTVTNGIRYNDTDFNLDTSNGATTVTGTGKDDMLGLVANRHVAVLTCGWFNNIYANTARQNFTIYAAIFAINGSFINSYQIDGSGETYPNTPGTLTVRGAIIQSKRGAVSQFSGDVLSAGYAKNYAHDPRMMFDSPPNFLRPVDSGWEITEWIEK